METTYNCKCRKCLNDFISKNALDTDGDGLCEECTTKKSEMVKEVERLLIVRRAQRPKVETNTVILPGYSERGN